MKTKIIEFLLMICMVIMSVMPVMAEGEGKDIQPAIDAYDAMKVVLSTQVGDVEALEAAFEKVTTTNEELGLEYEDLEVLEAHDPEYWNVMTQAGAIVNMSGVLDEYELKKNAKTALEVVNLYEELEPDYGQLLAGWFLDIDSIYEDAKQNVPSQNVLDVYEAYKKVQTALLFGYDEDFVKACEGFEAVLDVYNALSEDDLNTLAALMGLGNGEEAFNQILFDWINANTILELGAVYDAYVSNPNADTAKALVEKYDEVFGNTELFTPEDFELFRNAVFGIGDYYEEAKMLLADAVDEEEVDKDEVDKDEVDKEASPKTGDSFDMMLPFVVMAAAACAIVATVKRRVTK